jgi:tetratricopeptide (TPR) repeat protein
LQAYKGKNGKWNHTDFYQLGYAFYQQKNYESAILQFNKIIDGNDFLAQNAYYHLAESYLNTDKKQQALNAFKTASEMNFDAKIQEDAALNYTKLSYEIGNPYVSTPEILKSFMDNYPTNPNNAELKSLLINSFITSKNYTEALILLEKNKTPENKQIAMLLKSTSNIRLNNYFTCKKNWGHVTHKRELSNLFKYQFTKFDMQSLLKKLMKNLGYRNAKPTKACHSYQCHILTLQQYKRMHL